MFLAISSPPGHQGRSRRGESITPGGLTEVRRKGFTFTYITPGPPFSGLSECVHLKKPRGQQHVAVEQPVKILALTGLWDAAHHHLTSAVSGVILVEPGCICCIFVKPFAQPAANTLTRMISYYITHNWLFIAIYIAGAGPGAVSGGFHPLMHRLQRPPDKGRDMNKGQGSLPWATKAIPENKNSTERAHKRQKILPSCQLLSRPCLQRRGVQGQAIPSAKEPQQRAHQHVPGPGLPLQPRRALP